MAKRKSKIAELKNLGPASRRWLNAVGIRNLADLQREGSVDVYRMVRQAGFPASLNLLYALEAAILEIHWLKLPKTSKEELKRAVGAFDR